MARIIASICVCSFLVLNFFCQPAIAVIDLPGDIMQLAEISEADLTDPQFSDLKSIGQPPCRFLRRHLEAALSVHQANQLNESSTKSCPIESQFGTEVQPPKIWFTAWAKISQQSGNLNSWTVQSALRFSRQMNCVVNEIVNRQNLLAQDFANAIQRLLPLQSENTFPVSLPGNDAEKEESATDQESDHYWQYYEDCDYWKVIFAMALRNSHFDVSCLTSQCVAIANQHPIAQLFDGLIKRNLLKTFNATIQLMAEFHDGIECQYRIQEFHDIETSGIWFASRKRTISRSLRAGFKSHVQAVTGVVSQVRLEHFIWLTRSYPANALRSGGDLANRFSSLR